MGLDRAAYIARCGSGDGASNDGSSMPGRGGSSWRNFSTPALPLGPPTALIASNTDGLADHAAGEGQLSLPSRAVLTLEPLANRLGLVRRPAHARLSTGSRERRELPLGLLCKTSAHAHTHALARSSFRGRNSHVHN